PALGEDGTVCGIRFQTRELLGFHLTTHRETDQPIVTATPGNGFDIHQCLSPQPRDTHDIISYECPAKNSDGTICGMRFRTRDLLYSHICTAHSKVKSDSCTRRHCCKSCHQLFKTRADLAQHIATHIAEGMLECPQCGIVCESEGE
ncbi:hypothetical protein KIPB_014758, partial [Kipferlia bialata]